MLATVFGEDGELPARRAGPGHQRSPRPIDTGVGTLNDNRPK
jgi:hypothetical protein